MANAYQATANTKANIKAKIASKKDAPSATRELAPGMKDQGGDRYSVRIGNSKYNGLDYDTATARANGAPIQTKGGTELRSDGTVVGSGVAPIANQEAEKDSPLTPDLTPAQSGQVPYDQALKNLSSGGLSGGALQQAQESLAGAYGQSKYQQAHQQLQKSGGIAPGDGGAAMSKVYESTPYEANTQVVDQYMSEDPMINGIFSQITQLLNPKQQATTLMQDYKKLYKDSGLDEINEELIDAETVLNGTEADIRNEIQTAGGFGTESQIQALSLARNKGLLTRYNALAQMKTDATNQLNTMMSLNQQDKQMAQQKIDSQISTLFNFANFRQTAVNAYKETARFALQTMGADNLYASMKNDPVQTARYEKMMGLPSGGLAIAATTASTERARKATLENLQTYGAQLDITKKERELGIGVPQNQGQLYQAEDKVSELNTLIGDVSATGTNALSRFDPLSAFTGRQQNFISGVEQLRTQLTLEALQNAKANGATFGALSEGELSLLNASATKLGTWALKNEEGQVTGYNTTDKALKNELTKINNYAKLDAIKKGANPQTLGVIIVDGQYMMQNWDGTVSAFRE